VLRRSRIAELAIEVVARPAEKKKNHGEEAGAHGHDKCFSFPTLVDQVIEENEEAAFRQMGK
jgi:hypothetical protein